jgi:hypothetical protein
MPPIRFEPTISVLERAKTVRVLDRAATAIVRYYICQSCISELMEWYAYFLLRMEEQCL